MFQKGKSGNPGGRTNDKPWADALRVVTFRDTPAGFRRLLAIAEKCAAAAENGDMQAVKEIGDRLDGKPAQESTVTVNRGVTEQTDAEIAERLADLRSRGVGASDGDGAAPLDPSQLN